MPLKPKVLLLTTGKANLRRHWTSPTKKGVPSAKLGWMYVQYLGLLVYVQLNGV